MCRLSLLSNFTSTSVKDSSPPPSFPLPAPSSCLNHRPFSTMIVLCFLLASRLLHPIHLAHPHSKFDHSSAIAAHRFTARWENDNASSLQYSSSSSIASLIRTYQQCAFLLIQYNQSTTASFSFHHLLRPPPVHYHWSCNTRAEELAVLTPTPRHTANNARRLLLTTSTINRQ